VVYPWVHIPTSWVVAAGAVFLVSVILGVVLGFLDGGRDREWAVRRHLFRVCGPVGIAAMLVGALGMLAATLASGVPGALSYIAALALPVYALTPLVVVPGLSLGRGTFHVIRAIAARRR